MRGCYNHVITSLYIDIAVSSQARAGRFNGNPSDFRIYLRSLRNADQLERVGSLLQGRLRLVFKGIFNSLLGATPPQGAKRRSQQRVENLPQVPRHRHEGVVHEPPAS